MPKGKLSAQVAHASLDAAYSANQEMVSKWRGNGAKKVVLKVLDRKELLEYIRKAKRRNLTTTIIKDAGRTFLLPGTISCGAIGPAEEDEIDKVISELRLL